MRNPQQHLTDRHCLAELWFSSPCVGSDGLTLWHPLHLPVPPERKISPKDGLVQTIDGLLEILPDGSFYRKAYKMPRTAKQKLEYSKTLWSFRIPMAEGWPVSPQAHLAAVLGGGWWSTGQLWWSNAANQLWQCHQVCFHAESVTLKGKISAAPYKATQLFGEVPLCCIALLVSSQTSH